ncbi:MAG: hypothetical protein LBO79_02470 [Zoogloeaceae bacterium]|nr:hypothetical protein [Zoogloeaceae bacterium]
MPKYIARKGSVTVDGCSLTTNTVTGDMFTIWHGAFRQAAERVVLARVLIRMTSP